MGEKSAAKRAVARVRADMSCGPATVGDWCGEHDGRGSGGLLPLVAVVDAADTGEGNDLGVARRPRLDRPRLRAVLVQRQVATVFAVVAAPNNSLNDAVGMVKKSMAAMSGT